MNQMNHVKWIAFVAIVFSACKQGSADKKVPELASDMCGCFTKFEASLSPDAKSLMKEVSVSADPQKDMIAGMSKLKPEDAMEFGKKMSSIADRNSEVYKCMEAFDKKHGSETTTDKKALTEKLLSEMQGRTNCPTGAAIINLSLAKDKNTGLKN